LGSSLLPWLGIHRVKLLLRECSLNFISGTFDM
jgi:hypothetical protein